MLRPTALGTALIAAVIFFPVAAVAGGDLSKQDPITCASSAPVKARSDMCKREAPGGRPA